MPLPVILGAIAVVLLAVVGISVFSWRVYARAGVGPAAVEVGLGGPGSSGPNGPNGSGGPSILPAGSSSWLPLALLALGGAFLVSEL